MRSLLLALAIVGAASASAQTETTTDALPGVPFQEGDVLGDDRGMTLEIGPFQRPYPVSHTYAEATRRGEWKATIGRDGSLENWIGGLPFDPSKLDCKGDPLAATKIIWNFKKAWNGSGADAEWYYSDWDRGEQLPLYCKGSAKGIMLARRVEPEFIPNAGDVFAGEKRLGGGGITVVAPQDARGIMTLSYAYKKEDGPLDQAKNQDTWVYVPDLRRVAASRARSAPTPSRAPTSRSTTCAASTACRRSTSGRARASSACSPR